MTILEGFSHLGSVNDWTGHEQLFKLYDYLLGETSLTDVLNDIGMKISGMFSAEDSSIFLLRPENQQLEARALVHQVMRQIQVPQDHSSLAGHCAITGESFIVPDAYGDLSFLDARVRFDRSWDEIHGFRTRDIMCAPAIFKNQVVGVLQVLNRRDGQFCPQDLEALSNVGRVVGYSLYHAHLYDNLSNMKQMQRERARVMSVMVHELKSPLAAARVMLQAISYDALEENEKPDYLKRIVSRLDSMQQMIKDSLEFAQVESGEALGEIGIYDLNAIVEQLVEDYRTHAEVKGLKFVMQTTSEPLPVRFDQRGLQLVASNLISNAVKYTETGSVTVTTRKSTEGIALDVTDTGIGIPEADIRKLFQEFYRASNARNSSIEGTGVGLASVKHIVERFGGELRLHTVENAGSTFTVIFPVPVSGKQVISPDK